MHPPEPSLPRRAQRERDVWSGEKLRAERGPAAKREGYLREGYLMEVMPDRATSPRLTHTGCMPHDERTAAATGARDARSRGARGGQDIWQDGGDYDLSATRFGKRHLPFPVSTNDVFDVAAAERLLWDARIHHAASRYTTFRQIADDAARQNEFSHIAGASIDADGPAAAAVRVALDIMRDLDMIAIRNGSICVTDGFRKMVDQHLAGMRREPPITKGGLEMPETLFCVGAISYCCIAEASKLNGVGLPASLVNVFTGVIHSAMSDESGVACEICGE